MLTSQVQILTKTNGFTLIELVLVIFIFALVSGFVFARFELGSGSKQDDFVANLSTDLAILRQESASDASIRVVEIDILNNTLKAGFIDIHTGFRELKQLFADDKLRIVDVVINGEKFSTSKAYMRIYPSGLVDRTILHMLTDTDSSFTVLIHPLTSKVSIMQGHVEENTPEIVSMQKTAK